MPFKRWFDATLTDLTDWMDGDDRNKSEKNHRMI